MKPVTRVAATGAASALALGAAHGVPAVWFLPRLRLWLRPHLAGLGAPGRVALTFDDGPHPVATPEIMRVLDEYGVQATFFLLGTALTQHPRLGEQLAAAGHELGVHGWNHRPLMWKGPRRTRDELTRTRDAITYLTGYRPEWFRPPYGVSTTPALRASHRLGMTPVLWTCWGRDWSRRATAATVRATVTDELGSGGTILLHDSDTAATPNSWHSTLGALPHLLEYCRQHGWQVGPLREHALPRHPRPTEDAVATEPSVPPRTAS